MIKRTIEDYEQHLRIAKELAERAREGSACGYLGNAYFRIDDFKQAKEYHKQCLQIAKELGKRDEEGRTYGNLGITCKSLGDF